jgi:hypothetical protein
MIEALEQIWFGLFLVLIGGVAIGFGIAWMLARRGWFAPDGRVSIDTRDLFHGRGRER